MCVLVVAPDSHRFRPGLESLFPLYLCWFEFCYCLLVCLVFLLADTQALYLNVTVFLLKMSFEGEGVWF